MMIPMPHQNVCDKYDDSDNIDIIMADDANWERGVKQYYYF